MKRFNMETMKNKRTLLIIIVTILIACACIGIYKHNSKPGIKNTTTTKTVSSNKSKNNKKTTDIKPENKSRETEEKEEKVKQETKSNAAPAIKDTVKKSPIKKTENKPAAKSKPVEKKGHWETKTKKVKVGEKKVIDQKAQYIDPQRIGSRYVCDCGWKGTPVYGDKRNGMTIRDTDDELDNHLEETDCPWGYKREYVYSEAVNIPEKYHMEPIYETKTEKVWVED